MSVIGQAYLGVVIGSILWWIWGYSLTFGPGEGDEGAGQLLSATATAAAASLDSMARCCNK